MLRHQPPSNPRLRAEIELMEKTEHQIIFSTINFGAIRYLTRILHDFFEILFAGHKLSQERFWSSLDIDIDIPSIYYIH